MTNDGIADEQASNLSMAIAVLSAWHESSNSDQALVQEIADEALSVNEGVPLASGLISVAGVLLLRLSAATETPPLELLQDIARRYGEDRID